MNLKQFNSKMDYPHLVINSALIKLVLIPLIIMNVYVGLYKESILHELSLVVLYILLIIIVATVLTIINDIDTSYKLPVLHGLSLNSTIIIGRRNDKIKVQKLIKNCKLVAITGIEGAGKTEIAKYCAYIWSKSKDKIISDIAFINASDEEVLKKDIAKFREKLVYREERINPKLDYICKKIYKYCFGKERKTLIIYDNVCDKTLLNKYSIQGPNIYKLITSRNENILHADNRYHLNVLSKKSSIYLLKNRLSFKINEENIEKIIELCRKVPGALINTSRVLNLLWKEKNNNYLINKIGKPPNSNVMVAEYLKQSVTKTKTREPVYSSVGDNIYNTGAVFKVQESAINRINSSVVNNIFNGSKIKINSKPIRCSMPLNPTEIIGRDQELNEIYDKLIVPNSNPVAITGLTGIGKTELAIYCATVWTQSDPKIIDDIAFIDASDKETFETKIRNFFAKLYPDVRDSTLEEILMEIDNYYSSTEKKLLMIYDDMDDTKLLKKYCLYEKSNIHTLITSMNKNIMNDNNLYHLDLLSKDSSIFLFKNRLSFTISEDSMEKIMELCDGLPIALINTAEHLNYRWQTMKNKFDFSDGDEPNSSSIIEQYLELYKEKYIHTPAPNYKEYQNLLNVVKKYVKKCYMFIYFDKLLLTSQEREKQEKIENNIKSDACNELAKYSIIQRCNKNVQIHPVVRELAVKVYLNIRNKIHENENTNSQERLCLESSKEGSS